MFDPNEHLIKLRGGIYLEVKWRIVWFRQEHPGGQIATEVISKEPPIVRAIIYDEEGRTLASGHASVPSNKPGQQVWTGREIEKAETAAIGRALAHAGYGTQFTGEEEEEYLADSPVAPERLEIPSLAAREHLLDALVRQYGGTRNAIYRRLVALEAQGVLQASMSDEEVLEILEKRAGGKKTHAAESPR